MCSFQRLGGGNESISKLLHLVHLQYSAEHVISVLWMLQL